MSENIIKRIKTHIAKLALSLVDIALFLYALSVILQIAIQIIKYVNTPVAIVVGIYIVYGAIVIATFWATSKIADTMKVLNIDEIDLQLKEIDDLKDKLEKSQFERKNNIERLIALETSLVILEELLSSSRQKKISETEFQKLLLPIIIRRSEIFGYSSDELFNFAIYIWNSNGNCLDVKFRKCDDRIPVHNRSWQRGNGHVGICFAQGKMIFNKVEAKDSDLKEAFGYTDDDLQYYCGTVSAPIFSNKDPKEPIGVLNITSSNGNQFKEEKLDRSEDIFFIETFTKILSIYIENRRII